MDFKTFRKRAGKPALSIPSAGLGFPKNTLEFLKGLSDLFQLPPSEGSWMRTLLEHFSRASFWENYLFVCASFVLLVVIWRKEVVYILATNWKKRAISCISVPIKIEFQDNFSQDEIRDQRLVRFGLEREAQNKRWYFKIRNRINLASLKNVRFEISEIQTALPLNMPVPIPLEEFDLGTNSITLGAGQEAKVKFLATREWASEVFFLGHPGTEITLVTNGDITARNHDQVIATYEHGAEITVSAYSGIWLPRRFKFRIRFDEDYKPRIVFPRSER